MSEEAEKNYGNLKITGAPSEIRTEHFLNTNIEGYLYSANLGDTV
jgi:hypothetical protein